MFYKKTIDDTREEIGARAEKLTEQLRDTSDVVTYALVIVGAIAVTALIVALARPYGNGGAG